jgi:hypothetical protein
MQMAEENLKLKATAIELKTLGVLADNGNGCEVGGRPHVPLAKKYKDMLTKLGEQHKKFMAELGKVKLK